MKVLKEDVWTGIKKNDSPLTEYDVLQNYPNPAAGSTTVKVNLHKPADLKLRIVNKLGQQVISLDAGHRLQGMNEITFDVSGLAGGVYCYTVIAGETSISKKMIVE